MSLIRKISIQDLKPGMRILDSGISWFSQPFLYSSPCLIENEEQIKEIESNGFTRAYVDLSNFPEVALKYPLPDEELKDDASEYQATTEVTVEEREDRGPRIWKSPDREYDPRDRLDREEERPQVSLAVELPVAKQIYESSLAIVRNFIKAPNIKHIPSLVEESKPFMDSLLGSLDRNPMAILSLTKLRRADEYTWSHCVNVAILAMLFCDKQRYPKKLTTTMGMAGLFHDIGKTQIPGHILNFPGKLSEQAFKIMTHHPTIGYEIVRNVPNIPKEVVDGVYQHHERLNGKGYPNNLSGDEISETGKLLAVVDVYDALSSRRPYKGPLPQHKCLSIIYSMREEELDPYYVDRFIRCLNIYPLASAVELSNGFRGVVAMINEGAPMLPVVIVTQDNHKANMAPRVVDLSSCQSLYIDHGISMDELGVDPVELLKRFCPQAQ